MTSDLCYRICQFAINKNQSGYLSPEDFGVAINQGQRSFADWLIGQYQEYLPQRAQARVSWGQNQNVRESLTPIIYGYILNADINGIAPYPADYEKTDAMTSMYGFQRIRFASQDRLYSFMNSQVDPIATNPIYLVKDIGFQFYPITIAQARLSYVKTPPNIVWGYTLDADNLPVWNPAASVDPVWSDIDMYEVICRALRLIGVNLQANVVSEYANQITKTGQ